MAPRPAMDVSIDITVPNSDYRQSWTLLWKACQSLSNNFLCPLPSPIPEYDMISTVDFSS